MTIEEMTQTLKDLGLKKKYIPVWDAEPEHILLKTRRGIKVVDGVMKGSEIFYNGQDFVVWTCQHQKAGRWALAIGLKVKRLTGEAILFVPPSEADRVLPQFGAKVRRNLSEDQLNALKARMQAIRNKRSLGLNPGKNANLDTQGA